MPPEKLRFSKGTEVLIPRVGEDPMDYNHCTWLSLKGVAIGEMISVFNTDQDPLFSATMFNATLQKEFAVRVEGGSVTNLYFDKLRNIDISYPSLPEQKKIAAFFENIDNLITLHQRKLDNVKEYKSGMLQKMFPKEGEDIPEVRFPGFTDAWEQRKLGECCGIFLGLTYTPEYVEEGIAFISSKDIANDYLDLSDHKYISEEEFNSSSSNAKPIRGDILFTRVGSNLGHPVVIETDEKLCVFVSLGYLRVNKGINNYFMKHWMNSDDFKRQLYQKTGGGAKVNVNTGWLKTFDFYYPASIEEQKKISSFLSELDNLITLHQCKLDELKEYKKGLLQQMFV